MNTVPDINVTTKAPADLKVDALVVGVIKTDDGAELAAPSLLPKATATELRKTFAALGVTGEANTIHRVPAGIGIKASVLVLAGLGTKPRGGFDSETLRRAAGSATSALTGVSSVGVALPNVELEHTHAVAEGALLGAYQYMKYRTGPASESVQVSTIDVVAPTSRGRELKAGLERASILAAAVHGVRDLVNMPPIDLFPAAFADIAKATAKGSGAKVQVLDETALAAGGYGGLLGVGQGSTRGPRLVKITWSPSRPAGNIALVGKGITFDSGGLSIKPAASMETMKSDMAGAAAVLHTVVAAAKLAIPVAVTGYLAIAENMPSGTAQRPSDVITIRGGRTVEVLNTDAEGRLVLADALVAASESKPDAILDIATLTGAQMVALGARVSAVMGTEEIRSEVVTAAGVCGEQFWPMPLPPELKASMKSKVADIANIGDRFGGMLVAGLFLQEFVDGHPWAHLDIAGPSFNEGEPHDYTPVGGTGVGVRTMLSFIEGRATQRNSTRQL